MDRGAGQQGGQGGIAIMGTAKAENIGPRMVGKEEGEGGRARAWRGGAEEGGGRAAMQLTEVRPAGVGGDLKDVGSNKEDPHIAEEWERKWEAHARSIAAAHTEAARKPPRLSVPNRVNQLEAAELDKELIDMLFVQVLIC